MTGRKARARRRAARGLVSGAVSLALSAGLLAGTAYAHPAAAHGAAPVPRTPSIPVSPIVSDYRKPAPAPNWKATAPAWPVGAADVRLPAVQHSTDRATPRAATPNASPVPAMARAGTLPVWIAGASASGGLAEPFSAHVSIAPKAAAGQAGINGVLLSTVRTDGAQSSAALHVTLSYAQFQDAFGADWDARLALVALPACALTTPSVAACRVQTPVKFTNDLKAHTLQADVTLPGTAQASGVHSAQSQQAAAPALVLGATSTASSDAGGGGGDFTATSLKASGSWQAGGSADAFTWSYPIPVPAVPGGLAPKVQLSYNSQSQDGLTSSTNNQPSNVGDGWNLPESYIERSYPSCHQNQSPLPQTYDNCWSSNNTLTISLNGSTSTLVQDDASGAYHPANDSNERIQFLTGAPNGAHNGEYWVVTTTDGTQYYFGQNQLPGWASGNATTNSVWTEPVYATASGQPCYSSTFANSWCQQAYRWNLDYVVDTHNDAISYWYNNETNYYAMDQASTASSQSAYTRGGYLAKIQYGQRAGQVYSTTPAAQVTFTANGRCDTSSTGCATSGISGSTSDWPDVPYDMNCASGATCSTQAPSFWTEYEITGIQTQALSGTSLANVDNWALTYSFPPTGDTTTPSLALASITRTGQDNTAGGPSAPALPPVVFTTKPLANRVAISDGYPPITRPRLYTITTETGEQVTVNYSAPACGSATPSDDSQNTMLCYPGYWTPTGKAQPIKDYFNKYIVNSVTDYDPTTKDTIQTTYTPGGSPAWHYDDNPLVPTTPTNQRTWDQWRGFGQMTVSTGTAPDPITKSVYSYFRGMDGDYLTSSSNRAVSVTDSRNDPAVADYNQYAGVTYETQVYNGASVVTDTITDPWTSAPTATHALTGLPTLYAFLTGTADSKVYTPLANGSTRETETDYTHDAYGRVTATNDQGDVSTTSDDLCTTVSYADNSTAWILDKAAETKTVSVNCSTTPAYPANAVSDTLTFYDGSTTLGSAPSVGDVTMTQQAVSYTGATPVYATMSTTTVDQYGRTLSSTDPDNRKTTTTYTPATGAQPTSVTATDPLGHKTTITFDSLRDLPLSKTDPAGYVTSQQYDNLGRVTAVFKPGITPAALKYTYTVSSTGPSIVDTYTLDSDASGYHVSETLYDALLRAFETQTQTPDNTRNIADTYYNSDGWVSETTDPYNNAAAVSTTPVQAQAGLIPSATGYTYDGAGRKTAAIAYAKGSETWQTAYTYGGNFTTAVPPAGATATTSVTDARGRQTDLIQYYAGVPTDYVNDPSSDYSDIKYAYTPAGKPATETDAAGNQWSWTYNLLSQSTDTYDPDAGHTVSTFDNAGQLLTTTDARGKQTTNTYDLDGRLAGSYDTTTTQTLSAGNQLTKYTYDTLATGYPTSTTSYSNGDTYTSATTSYNALAKPKGTKVTLAGEGTTLVPTTGYQTNYTYTLAGLLASQSDPASGGLNAETITYTYDLFGETLSVRGSGGYAGDYVDAAGYSEYGQPVRYTFGPSTAQAWADMTYDPQSRVLQEIKTSTTSTTLDDLSYTFGNTAGTVSKGSGLLTQTVDKQNNGTVVDTQCSTYDYATRLQQAWTATDQCAATPTPGSSTTVGGPLAPYWQSWTYDAAGNRRTQTDHDTSGNTANDTTTTYNYPTQGSNSDQPHTLSNTTATGPNAAANTTTYGYDIAGNTTSIAGGALGNQTLTWTTQGKLQSDATTAGTSSYVYDANGNMIVRRDPGSTVFYMGDEQLTLNTATNAVTAVRYYSISGTVIAVRNSNGQYSYLIPDRQGTDQLAINASTLAVTRRQYTPFGSPRGTVPTWAGGDKGYIGGNNDATTGLETLGARTYDTINGRFLSPDPVFEATDPTQLGGYDYAGNDPVTGSDPTGNMTLSDGGCDSCSTAPPSDPKPNVFDPIGLGLVSVQETDTRFHDFQVAYENAEITIARHNDWSDIQYELALWQQVCTDRSLCGFGGGSIGHLIADEAGAVFYGGSQPADNAPIFAPILIGQSRSNGQQVGMKMFGASLFAVSGGALGKALPGDQAANGDLGPNWRPAPESSLPKNGCEAVACEIQSRIGGKIAQIKPNQAELPGAKYLPKYRNVETGWKDHYVVVRDGNVYDEWTGRTGEPVQEYLSHWQWGDEGVLQFTPGELTPNEESGGGGYTFTPNGPPEVP